MNAKLISPCGLDCSVCSHYLAWFNDLPKGCGRVAHCTGCRPRNKQCALLKGHCERLRDNRIDFCFQCRDFACARLKHLDERYRQKFGISPIANLEEIQTKGISVFIRQQQKRFACSLCGGTISVHDRKCCTCGQSDAGQTAKAE